MTSSPAVKERVLAEIARTRSATRREVLRTNAILFACAIVGALVVFFEKGGFRPSGRPPLVIALTSLGTAVIAGVAISFLFTRGRSMLGRPRALLWLVATTSTLGFLAWKYGISMIFDLTARYPDRPGFRCLALSISSGALPLCAALIAARRSVPLRPATIGGAFGAGAGLGSAVLVDLWCPVAYLPHLFLGHVLPIALLALLGALVGRQVLRMTRV
jgi:hypothetical protein